MLVRSLIFGSCSLMMDTYCSCSKLNQILCQCLSVGTLTTLSLLLELAPHLSEGHQKLVFSSSAYAQVVFSDVDILNYAKAVLKMEPYRQDANDKIKQITGNSLGLDCSDSGRWGNLPINARQIADNYCKQSQAIVEDIFGKNKIGLFNAITTAAPRDRSLFKRIQDAMLRLQNGG